MSLLKPNKESLILMSDRPDDIRFFEELVQDRTYNSRQVGTWEDLVKALSVLPDPVVLWNIDDPAAGQGAEHPYSKAAVQGVLTGSVPSSRVFAVSEKTTNLYPEFCGEESSSQRCFQHNLLRRFNPITMEVYSRVIRAAFDPLPLGFERYFPEGTKVHKVTLKKAEHRGVAVEATQNFLMKAGVESRLAAKAAQTIDELLMNAIFDAPCDRNGTNTRKMLARQAKFDFGANEQVELESALTDHYIGFCVTDYYGSLNRDVILRFLNQDYRDQSYKLTRYGPGAGLGLYGIAQAGLSLLLACKPRFKTEAMVFFPRVKSYRSFKSGFQFTACFSLLGANAPVSRRNRALGPL